MAKIAIRDNEIYAIFDVKDIRRIKTYRRGEIKQVFVKTKNGAIFEADKEFYRFCLQRMSDLDITIEIEEGIWLSDLDIEFVDPFVDYT